MFLSSGGRRDRQSSNIPLIKLKRLIQEQKTKEILYLEEYPEKCTKIHCFNKGLKVKDHKTRYENHVLKLYITEMSFTWDFS